MDDKRFDDMTRVSRDHCRVGGSGLHGRTRRSQTQGGQTIEMLW